MASVCLCSAVHMVRAHRDGGDNSGEFPHALDLDCDGYLISQLPPVIVQARWRCRDPIACGQPAPPPSPRLAWGTETPSMPESDSRGFI